ncbi:unnamed protein product [Calypogeia fissa]
MASASRKPRAEAESIEPKLSENLRLDRKSPAASATAQLRDVPDTQQKVLDLKHISVRGYGPSTQLTSQRCMIRPIQELLEKTNEALSHTQLLLYEDYVESTKVDSNSTFINLDYALDAVSELHDASSHSKKTSTGTHP